MPGPALAFALAMVVPFAAIAARFARALDGSGEHPHASALLFGGLLAACFLLFFLGVLPIIGLYLGIWASALLSFGVPNKFAKRSLFIANANAFCLMLACSLLLFVHLSLLEAMGADADIVVAEAGRQPVVQILLAGALVLASVFVYMLMRGLKGAYPATTQGDRALTHFHTFVFFGILYELLDLVPFSFDTWFTLMPYFLCGGSILLMLFFVIFSLSTAYLGAEAFREGEHITLERRKRDEEMRMRLYRKEATSDPLTSLNVRRIGHEHLARLEESKASYCVAFIDVNDLKEINDEFGHATGDACLQAFARALSDAFPNDDIVRWGGDEFLVIVESDCTSDLEARLSALSAQTESPTGELPLRFCFGTASSESGDAETVLKRADNAMYVRKRAIHQTECEGAAQ